jgi:hypothetical protein
MASSTLHYVPLCVLFLLSLPAHMAAAAAGSGPGADCFCNDTSLCAPISAASDRKELFVFQVDRAKNWRHYNWNMLTTVVLFDGLDPEMLCHAHANNGIYISVCVCVCMC